MEKYSQFRDKGTGVAPFFPIPRESSGVYLPFHIFLFICRVPLLIAATIIYFIFFSWLPTGSLVKKAATWLLLGIPGIWWIDLQIDGVRRGSLAKHAHRLPRAGTVIASSHTSPIDALYLAAIFDPIFTASYPSTRLVEPISLFQAMLRALLKPRLVPSPSAKLVTLTALLKQHPGASVVVLPECTTSNGRAILALSPSVLTAPPRTKIFPVNLRYSPADVTSPIPGTFLSFLWDLCSRPTHCIRVRIADAIDLPGSASRSATSAAAGEGFDENFFTTSGIGLSFDSADTLVDDSHGTSSSAAAASAAAAAAVLDPDVEERKVLDRIADDLARLGRAKRVGLGARDKVDFLKVWFKTRSAW